MLSPCDREKENSSRIVASAKKEPIVAKIPQTAVENSPVLFSPLTVPRPDGFALALHAGATPRAGDGRPIDPGHTGLAAPIAFADQ